MLTDTQIESFHGRGFLNAGTVLTPDEVQGLSDALDEIIEIGPEGYKQRERKPVIFRPLGGNAEQPVWQIVDAWYVSEAFEQLIKHPFVVNAIKQLTGFGDLQVWHDQVQYKPAHHGGATGWHQDAPLWPSIEPMTPVSAWIPFDDAEVENGCMWMVPGSHRWGNQHATGFMDSKQHLKKREEFEQITEGFEAPDGRELEVVACPVKRGEVHFHHSLTWHGSPENHSDKPRRALAIHYMTSEAVYTGRQHAMSPYIQVDVGGRMSEAGPMFPRVCVSGEPVAV